MKAQTTFIPCEIDPIKIDCGEIQFQKDHYGHPVILVIKDGAKEIFTALAPLLLTIPEINTEPMIEKLSRIINFLVKGDEFEFISDPETFKKEYKEEIQREENSFEIQLLAFGKYNVEEVSKPKIIRERNGDLLVFYVKKKIPYQVSCEFPVTVGNLHYKILELQDT